MKTPLDVSRWPADASGYITRTADALRPRVARGLTMRTCNAL